MGVEAEHAAGAGIGHQPHLAPLADRVLVETVPANLAGHDVVFLALAAQYESWILPLAIILVVPVVMPLVKAVGIDPVHFGLIVTINLGSVPGGTTRLATFQVRIQ